MRAGKTTPSALDPFLPYFAYGANLCLAAMRRRCPRSEPVGPASLAGHALRIALPQDHPAGPGWATVTPVSGRMVPGALFRLHPDDLAALDEYEGSPELYAREETVVLAGAREIRAVLYRMREPLRPAKPEPGYVETLRRGYADFGLPAGALAEALREVL